MVKSCNKRKSATENLGFPPTKRQFLERNSSQNFRLTGFGIDRTETEPINWVSGDYDCSISESECTEIESKSGKTKSSDDPICNSYDFKDSSYCTGSTSLTFEETEISNRNAKLEEYCSEDMAEDRIWMEFFSSEFNIDEFEQEIKDGVELDEMNPSSCGLSSGNCSWNQNSEQKDKKKCKNPTIDQEFEQFFSTLMS